MHNGCMLRLTRASLGFVRATCTMVACSDWGGPAWASCGQHARWLHARIEDGQSGLRAGNMHEWARTAKFVVDRNLKDAVPHAMQGPRGMTGDDRGRRLYGAGYGAAMLLGLHGAVHGAPMLLGLRGAGYGASHEPRCL
eukprot:353684-Chlamydomonas_euryale.AAC.2